MTTKHRLLIAAALALSAGAAQADVISGPTLNVDGNGWNVTGLGFVALDNSTLTSFIYQNQGQADTIVLTDGAGNILDSVNTGSGIPSNTVVVDWALTSGNQYWLLQTTLSNELYAGFGNPLPSDSDIRITQSGTFSDSISGAVSNDQNWGANQFWAAFNDITTTPAAASVPEPATWVMMVTGLMGVGVRRYRRRGAVLA